MTSVPGIDLYSDIFGLKPDRVTEILASRAPQMYKCDGKVLYAFESRMAPPDARVLTAQEALKKFGGAELRGAVNRFKEEKASNDKNG